MIRVSIIGAGKVGQHFIEKCIDHPAIELEEVYNRTLSKIEKYAGEAFITDSLENLAPVDLFIITVADEAIEEIGNKLDYVKGLVVHVSGTTSYKKIKSNRRGVLYALQSFSENQEVDFSEIPFCLETEHADDYSTLETFAKVLSPNVYNISEQQRQKIHLSAVFANNFTNHLLGVAYDICKKNDVDFNVLKPLVKATFEKGFSLNPTEAQTGPALRKDEETIEKHRAQIENPKYLEIYNSLTKSIQETHGDKL